MSERATDEPDQRGELVVVRHGESLANVAFAYAERTGEPVELDGRDADVALSQEGRRQATALGRWLRTRPPPDTVYCSPYARARETWRIASDSVPAARDLPVLVDDRLRDREMGRLELLPPEVIRRRFPGEARRRAAVGQLYYRPLGGESLADVAVRVRGLVRELPRTGRTLVVAHDAVIAMLRYLIDELSEDDLREVPLVANASITRWISTAGGLRLATYGDTVHLGQPEIEESSVDGESRAAEREP